MLITFDYIELISIQNCGTPNCEVKPFTRESNLTMGLDSTNRILLDGSSMRLENLNGQDDPIIEPKHFD